MHEARVPLTVRRDWQAAVATALSTQGGATHKSLQDPQLTHQGLVGANPDFLQGGHFRQRPSASYPTPRATSCFCGLHLGSRTEEDPDLPGRSDRGNCRYP